jgi:hypothetical protein
LAATQEAYDQLAESWAHIASLVQQASQDADRLHVPIPQSLARGMADLLVFPSEIRQVGARRAGTWIEPIMERADEDPAGPEEPQ